MKNPKFENGTVKYFTGSISSEELDELIFGLEDDQNVSLFQSYLEIDYTTRYSMSQYNSEKVKDLLLKKIREEKRWYNRLRIKELMKYAAVGLLFLLIGLIYRQMTVSDEQVKSDFEDSDGITLTLSDGTVKEVSQEGSMSILDRKGSRVGLQKGNQLIYHKASTAKKIVFNTLKVPYGKRFVIILSDGTKAHLNSGTSLKYPMEFIKGEDRKVFLTGEGYFEVAKDKTHPFVINANDLNIQVLGTEFNLSAYAEDESIHTVLVEGSVGFFEKDSKFDETDQMLEPGQMAIWGKKDKTIAFKEADTDLYTGWMDGKIIFSHMRFGDIIKKLERNYNVTINNTYRDLDEAQFTASFDTETITQVLEAFKKNFPMRFTLDGNAINIEKP